METSFVRRLDIFRTCMTKCILCFYDQLSISRGKERRLELRKHRNDESFHNFKYFYAFVRGREGETESVPLLFNASEEAPAEVYVATDFF